MQIFNLNSSSKAGDHQLSAPRKKNCSINMYVQSWHQVFPATHQLGHKKRHIVYKYTETLSEWEAAAAT